MHCAIKGTPVWTARRRCSRGQSYTSLNAASCRASIVRRGRFAFSMPERTIITPPRLPSYVERASKRVLPSRRVEAAHARTHALVVVSFIKSRVSRGNACARARVNDRNRRLRPLLLAYFYYAIYSRERR